MTASTATIWEGPSVSIPAVNTNGNIYEETQVATAGQTIFNLATFTYTQNTRSIFVYKNGVMLRRAVDYAETTTSRITLAAGALVGDKLTFLGYAIASVTPPVTLNGLPQGGTVGQILTKVDSTDYNTTWATLTALATLLDSARQNVASASTVDLTGAVATQTRNIQITGSVQIDGFQITNGQLWAVKFAAALTLKNNANIVTQTGTDIAVQANDTCFVRATAANVVEIIAFVPASLNKVTTRSMVRLTVANGYGSTNTRVRRFTNTITNQGTDITYADSATLGGSFTINTTGVYSFTYTDNYNAGDAAVITLNDSAPTGSPVIADTLAASVSAGVNTTISSSWTGYLVAGSVIRARSFNGSPTGAAFCTVSAVRVA